MSGEPDPARVRELERRAFARPRSDADREDAAAAARELAELRALSAPAVVPSVHIDRAHDGSDLDDRDDLDDLDDRTFGERLADVSRRGIARARALPPSVLKRAAAAALAAGVFAASGVAIHAAITSPPPAYEVFALAEQPAGDEADLTRGDSIAFSEELFRRGTLVIQGPHLFGDRDDTLRVGVYREWLDADRIEVCAAIVADNQWAFRTVCATEQAFRNGELRSEFAQDGFRAEFGWLPDGDVVLETETTGATTVEEVLELGGPAAAAVEAAGVDLELAQLVAPWNPDVLAGPLELGERDGWRYYGLILEFVGSPWEESKRPQLCLVGGDDLTPADGGGFASACGTVERFAADGLSVQTADGRVARWTADGVLEFDQP